MCNKAVFDPKLGNRAQVYDAVCDLSKSSRSDITSEYFNILPQTITQYSPCIYVLNELYDSILWLAPTPQTTGEPLIRSQR